MEVNFSPGLEGIEAAIKKEVADLVSDFIEKMPSHIALGRKVKARKAFTHLKKAQRFFYSLCFFRNIKSLVFLINN
jgi:hypothetical protein